MKKYDVIYTDPAWKYRSKGLYGDKTKGSDDGFNLIHKMKNELKAKSKEMSIEEFRTQEADIFYEYLKL